MWTGAQRAAVRLLRTDRVGASFGDSASDSTLERLNRSRTGAQATSCRRRSRASRIPARRSGSVATARTRQPPIQATSTRQSSPRGGCGSTACFVQNSIGARVGLEASRAPLRSEVAAMEVPADRSLAESDLPTGSLSLRVLIQAELRPACCGRFKSWWLRRPVASTSHR